MDIIISDITPSPDGEQIYVSLKFIEGRMVQSVKGSIATEFFSETGLPTSSVGEMPSDREKADRLIYLIEKTDAVKRGISLLSYSASSKRGLVQRLGQKGVKREIAADAVEYIAECGYINEQAQAEAVAAELAKRLYGRMRIRNDMYVKGYDSAVIDAAIDECEIDFVELCRRRIEQMGGMEIFENKMTRAKAISSLVRHGFTMSEIKDAVKDT